MIRLAHGADRARDTEGLQLLVDWARGVLPPWNLIEFFSEHSLFCGQLHLSVEGAHGPPEVADDP